LIDTAETLRAKSRNATGRSFNPIGHISLDDDDAAARTLNLDLASRADGAFWIKCLYVSTTIQGGGVGRQAMDRVEEEATEAPLDARFLLLDTYHKDMFLREDLCKAIYGEVPKVSQPSVYWFKDEHPD
jgi:GNAT superfamily N-acetyltransferase